MEKDESIQLLSDVQTKTASSRLPGVCRAGKGKEGADVGRALKHCLGSRPGLSKVPPRREPSQDLPPPLSPALPHHCSACRRHLPDPQEQWAGEGALPPELAKGGGQDHGEPDWDHNSRGGCAAT